MLDARGAASVRSGRAAAAGKPAQTRVRRRRVLYISGFDPRGAAFYHRMYRDEAAKAAALTGLGLEVGPRRAVDPHVQAWTISAISNGERTETLYEFLRWDDIVRANWPRRTLRVWRDSVGALVESLRTGVFRRSWRASYPTAITGALPTLFILLQIVVIAFAAWAAAAVFGGLTGLPLYAGLPAAAVTAWGVFLLFQRLEGRLRILWLGRLFAFTVRDANCDVPKLEARRETFAKRLVEAARTGAEDEILLIGHSLGSPLAISVAARAVERDPNLGRHGPRVAVLILGSTMPMLALLPQAEWFRRDLRRLAEAEAVDWLEFTAPPDGACYALIDPLALAMPGYVPPAPLGPRPKLLNARIKDLIHDATYHRIKRDWMRVHFQYLMAGDRPAEYSYFAITAGPLTLADRFAHRPSVTGYAGLRPFRR